MKKDKGKGKEVVVEEDKVKEVDEKNRKMGIGMRQLIFILISVNFYELLFIVYISCIRFSNIRKSNTLSKSFYNIRR